MALLTLVRHCRTGDNGSGARFIGTRDVPPLEAELARAAALGRQLDQARYSRLWTSPLRRAERTLRAMFADREPVLDARLAERCFGDWQGQERAAVRAREPWAFTAAGHLRLEVTPPGGEPFELVCARVREVIATVARLPPHEHVFAVTHGGVLKTARYVLGVCSLEAASDRRERFLELSTFEVRDERPPLRSSGNPVEVTDADAPSRS